jgi:putative transposase
VRNRFLSTTTSDHDRPVAVSVLDRWFAAERPNQRWVGDTTEFSRRPQRQAYLAATLDLHSRSSWGWAPNAADRRHLTPDAVD